jgi:NADH-quinone oxidoreductase subunit D
MEDAACEPLLEEIRGELGDALIAARRALGELTLTIRPAEIGRAAACLKGRFRFSSLVDLCATDDLPRRPRFTVVYQLFSFRESRALRLRLETDGEEPVPTVSAVWPGAAWPEREVWDLHGVPFSGHPGLSRLLLWEGFDGHPLRKDFPLAGRASGVAPARPPDPGRPDAPDPSEGALDLTFGPHHPALHGLLRLRIRLAAEGDRIASCEPVIGYLHRGVEKLFEAQPPLRNLAFVDRLDFAAAATSDLAYSGAVEKLLGLAVSRRARLLRTLFAELQRIASHLLWLATATHDLGAVAAMPACLHEREAVLDLFERYCGARLTLSCVCPGGVPFDLPEGQPVSPRGSTDSSAGSSTGSWTGTWSASSTASSTASSAGSSAAASTVSSAASSTGSWTGTWSARCRAFLARFPARLDEIEARLEGDRGWKPRLEGLGALSPEAALEYGVTGPALRASGVDFDLRKALPYEAYGELDFEVPLGRNGDAYDRYRVRLDEIRQSSRMAGQCLDRLAATAPALGPPLGPPLDFRAAPAGVEAYHGIEGPRGEIGFFLAAGGGATLARCHVRAPSFYNLQVLPEIVRGHAPADLLAILGSLDIALGEVDR